jgi:hypothetical protein
MIGDWKLPDADFVRSFTTPADMHRNAALKSRNPMEREGRIRFFEARHRYTVDDKPVPLSVTALVNYYKNPFNAEEAVDRMKSGGAWPRPEYMTESGEPMTTSAIAKNWETKNAVASRRGTLLHWTIERFLNGDAIMPPHSPEVSFFMDFYRNWFLQRGLAAWRTEVPLFHVGMGVAGSADFLAKDANGDVVILDWKRCRGVDEEAFDNNRLCGAMDHLQATNMSTFALQLNIYRHMLESEYDYKVSGMYLAMFHPDQLKYVVVPVARMDREINILVDLVKSRGGVGAAQPSTAPFVVYPNLCKLAREKSHASA